MGSVALTVADLDRSRAFYEQALGLQASRREEKTMTLGTGGEPLIELYEDRCAPAPDRRASGLFHLAILVPTRRDLAFTLTRLVRAGRPLDGASDHLVSEALHLSDPDGHGIEIYRDRHRNEWPRTDGRVQMATLALDLDDVLAELEGAADLPRLAPARTSIGHVHLRVHDLAAAEEFYARGLGFDVMMRYPGALFVSAGRYHHHVGLNTWHSAGGPASPPGALGLRCFEITLPNRHELERTLGRARSAGIDFEPTDSGAVGRDPSGNGVRLSVHAASPTSRSDREVDHEGVARTALR